MNATLTTVTEVLWRRGRGIARALLLMGALAGMALGTVAYAQITFKDKSFAAALAAPAAPVASSGTTGTITFVDGARMPTTNDSGATSNNVTITPPGGMAADDFVLVYVAVRDNGTAQTIDGGGITPGLATNSGGQTWFVVGTQRQNNVNLRIFRCKFNGTWSGANPSFRWANSNAYQVWMVVFRGVDTTTPIDAGPSIAPFGAVTDIAIPVDTLPTVTANAMMIASWHSRDDNTWALQTAGWFNPNNVTHWRTNQGDDSSSSIGYKVKTTGTGSEAVTNRQSSSDAGIRSILALRPARAQLTITKPTGTVAGDVLVASIGFRPNCCDQPAANYDITPLDSGWTAVMSPAVLDNIPVPPPTPPNKPSNSLAVYWKVAGASEPAAYRWSFSVVSPTTFDAAAGGILKFSGVDLSATTPLVNGVEESGRNTTAGDQATPSITTTATNTMLVTSHSYASPTTAAWTAPSGMTSPAAVDEKAGGQSTAIFYGVQPAVGPTGQKRAIPIPDDDIGNAHILALRSTTPGTALTIPIPNGTVAGDVMVAAITVRGADRSITPPLAPNDWAEVRRMEQTAGTANLQVFYVRAAGASEPASYTWTLAATNTGAVGGILSFSGVDTTAPIVTNAIDNHGGNLWDGTATGVIRANEITTNVGGTVAVSAHSFVSSANWSPPAGAVAEDVDVASRRVANGAGISLGMYHYPVQALPGPTGNKDATASNDFDTGIGQILALKPAAPPVVTPGSFNAFETSTAAGAITGVIRTKVAGSAFSLDVVSIASGAQQAGFTDAVIVELLGNNTLGVALDAQNCPTSFTLVQTVAPNPTITGGRSTVSLAAVPNSWRDVRVRVRWPTTSPTVTWCSTDNFAIRPNTLASFAVTDTDWQTAGTGRALTEVTFGAVTHKAGRPLSVRATAVNAVAATTTNYTGAPTATLTACAGAACTATFGTLTLATTFAAGQLTSDVATYDNVGSFQVELVDSSFASVDAGDSSALEREIRSGTINVGRFVPDHFAVTLNTPVFGTACGSFTYIGQAFNYTTAPVITVTAQDFANNTTTLYADATKWWRITNTSVTPASQAARYSSVPVTTGTLDVSGLPAVASDPTILVAGSGMGTLTFSTGTGLFYTRTTPTAPASPYNADISLAVNVVDIDGVASASTASFGAATTGNGISFSSGKQMRFGRLAIRNASGSQLVPLPVQLEAQYWLGAPTNAFVTNAADNCTVIAANNDAMGNFTGNLSGSPTCETAISGGGTLSAGRRTLQLAAPGSGNNGSVDLTVNLGTSASGTTCTTVGGAPVAATTANLPHLQGNWTGGAYDQNPSARAMFGVYRGAEEVIFIRENF